MRYLRTPQLLVLATIQMSLFFLIYRHMFGGAIKAGRIPHVDSLVPGFSTTGVLFAGIGSATAMEEDLKQGFVDVSARSRSRAVRCWRRARSRIQRS